MTHRPTWTSALQRLRSAACALAVPLFLGSLAATAQAQVVISQVYGGGGNSGAVYTNDFVELHNKGAVPVSLAGWTVQYASATGTSWTNSTPLSGSIPAGGYYLVQLASGGAVGAPLPVTPNATGGTNISATVGKLALVNSTTLLTGACPLPGATVVDFVGYGATASCSETSPAPAPSAANAINRLNAEVNTCQDTGNNSVDFVTAAPLPRNASSAAQPCQGTGGGGGGGGNPVAAAIYTIQGSGATSPLVGQTVITSGVVTKINSNGFFIQDPTGDGNPATSDGIFVFTNPASFTAVQVGNLVQVTGLVAEFASGTGTAASPLTEITTVSAVSLLGSGQAITPAVITLPLAVGDSLERYEGMLVQIQNTMTVQQNFLQARYGQLTLGIDRHETPTNKFRPNSTQALDLAATQARSRLLLDDGSSVVNPNPTPYLLPAGTPRAGDTVSNLVGVLDFGLSTTSTAGPGLYRLHPTATPSFVASNPRPSTPPVVGGNVRVAAMNVLNFFTTYTSGQAVNARAGQGCSLGASVAPGNCRGADNPAEFARQLNKIVRQAAALDADVVGLMEIQNNGNFAVQFLVSAINNYLGTAAYATIALPAAGTGTDAIRTAIIYKPASLTPVGLPLSDPAAINNRPTLAQTFAAPNGERFTLVVNHLKSKGSCPSGIGPDADAGDGQGCWNATRVQQAQQLRTFVAQVQGLGGTNDVLLVGDFNAYAQEDPIFELTSNGFIDQVGRYNAFGYSYVFDGTAGRLDHAIASATLSPKVTGAAEWHINADELINYDYNLEDKQPSCATCAPDPYDGSGPYRASDHDPVLIGLNLAPIAAKAGAARTVVAPAARKPAAVPTR